MTLPYDDLWLSRLSEYLDGALSSGEQADMEQHLEHCEVCQTALRELQIVVSRLHAERDTPAAYLPAEVVWSRVATRLVVPPPSARMTAERLGGRWSARLLAASLLFAMGFASGAWFERARSTGAFGWAGGPAWAHVALSALVRARQTAPALEQSRSGDATTDTLFSPKDHPGNAPGTPSSR